MSFWTELLLRLISLAGGEDRIQFPFPLLYREWSVDQASEPRGYLELWKIPILRPMCC